MNKKDRKIFNRARDRIIIKLTALQKKHGEPIFSAAMRQKLLVDKEKSKAQKEILYLQNRMNELKKGIVK
jgi:hypothetical protein